MNALKKAGIDTLDRTANAPDGSRSREIDHYLRRHPNDEYLILDDDPELFEDGEKTSCLYVVDSDAG